MAVWLFATIAVVSGFLLIYPYVIYPALLRLIPRKPICPAAVDLRASLLFCAFNEAKSLPEKLQNLRELKEAEPTLEILAYDDASNDETYQLLSAAGDILTAVRGDGRHGKAAGMKRLASMAMGDILVFSDANVLLARDSITRLIRYYADDRIGGVCGTLHYVGDGNSETAHVNSSYWRLDEKLRTLESDTGNVMGADGSIFSIRRSLYPTFPDTVLDDLTVSMSVIFAGKRLIKAADVIAFERSVARSTEERRRKVRIGARAYHTHCYLRDDLRRMGRLDKFKYVSRKQIRWFGGLFAALGAVSAFAAIFLISPVLAGAVAVATFGLIALSATSRRGVLAKLREAAMAIFATFTGVLQGMRGRTVATWAPAKSR